MGLKVIKDGICQNTLTTVKTSVGEAAEVLGSFFNTRKEEVILVLRKGGDVSAFRKDLDWAVCEGANFGPGLLCVWHWAE